MKYKITLIIAWFFYVRHVPMAGMDIVVGQNMPNNQEFTVEEPFAERSFLAERKEVGGFFVTNWQIKDKQGNIRVYDNFVKDLEFVL